jgi:hypothetical protein
MGFIPRSKRLLPTILIALTIAAGFAYLKRQDIRDTLFRLEQGPIPEAVTREEFGRKSDEMTVEPAAENSTTEQKVDASTSAGEPSTAPEPKLPTTDYRLPTTINLKVLFIPQAPHQVWDEIHEETCEEASMAMIKAYLDGTKEMTREEMDKLLLGIVEYEKSTFGYFESTDADLTAAVMRGYLGIEGAEVVAIDDIEDLKREVAAGRPVILPASGKTLGNPNFRNGGPVYHMLVVKGYAKDRIITNDPGTRKGADYTYDPEILWEAIADWTGDGIDPKRKVMIVVR